MRTAKEYREIASTRCEAQSGTLALIYLVVGLISGLANGFGILIIGPLMMGFSMVIVNNYNNRKVEVSQVFDGFNDFVKNLVLGLLHTIYVFLWSLLFLIPGIVKSYSYAMSYYIALDHPEYSADECITKSKELMYGKRWELFCVDFSYIGWIILCLLTFGILTFWVYPKMETSRYAFYCDLVGKTEETYAEQTEEVSTEDQVHEETQEVVEAISVEAPAEEDDDDDDDYE